MNFNSLIISFALKLIIIKDSMNQINFQAAQKKIQE
jgi:hypothetical protein